jgi:hypothetical protein
MSKRGNGPTRPRAEAREDLVFIPGKDGRGLSLTRHAGLDPASMNTVLGNFPNPCSWVPDQVRDDVVERIGIEPMTSSLQS